MKRSLLSISVGLIASVVLAQGPVTSVNVVGFNKHTFERGKLYLIATAFEDIDGKRLSAHDVIGTQLPNGSVLDFYDGVTPYKHDGRSVSTNSSPSGWTTNITFHGFMGFWIKVPAAGAGGPGPFEVVLKGQVPGIGPNEANSSSNVVVQGLNMLGFPYTADVAFTNTGLYALPGNGHQLHIYNPATSNYLNGSFTKTVAGWPAPAKLVVLHQGQGFWFKLNQVSPVLDQEVRPYPNN